MTELNPIRLDLNVPTVATRDQQIAPGWQYPPIPPGSYSEPELEDPGVPLSHYLWALRRHRYKIIAFVINVAVVVYLLRAKRLFGLARWRPPHGQGETEDLVALFCLPGRRSPAEGIR